MGLKPSKLSSVSDGEWQRKIVYVNTPVWVPWRHNCRVLGHTHLHLHTLDLNHIEKYSELQTANLIVIFVDVDGFDAELLEVRYKGMMPRLKHADVFAVMYSEKRRFVEETSEACTTIRDTYLRPWFGDKLHQICLYTKEKERLIPSAIFMTLVPQAVAKPLSSVARGLAMSLSNGGEGEDYHCVLLMDTTTGLAAVCKLNDAEDVSIDLFEILSGNTTDDVVRTAVSSACSVVTPRRSIVALRWEYRSINQCDIHGYVCTASRTAIVCVLKQPLTSITSSPSTTTTSGMTVTTTKRVAAVGAVASNNSGGSNNGVIGGRVVEYNLSACVPHVDYICDATTRFNTASRHINYD